MYLTAFVYTFSIIAFAGLSSAAAAFDAKTLQIPNRLSLAVALVYPAYALAAPVGPDWVAALGLAAAVILVGFVLYSLRVCGAGDIKFMAAVTLWAGPALMIDLIFITALVGGVLALLLWFGHRIAQSVTVIGLFATPSDPSFGKQPMPYGVAIGIGAFHVALTLLMG